MSWLTKFKSLDQKFSWSFLGFACGILFFLVGLYTTFFYAKNAKPQLEILSDSPVYDIRENVSKLDIIFNGESIRQKGEMLTLLNLRFANRGNAGILIGSYDSKSPPTLRISDARIITIEFVGGSSNYLKEQAQAIAINNNDAQLSPVILDQDDNYTFKILVLHPEGRKPKLTMLGKIAGSQRIDIVNSVPVTNTSFLQRAAVVIFQSRSRGF